MIILEGKYGIAKVYTDYVEQTAISQIINLLNQPFVQGACVRIMPDVHAGAGCVIGFTADLTNMVIPNLIGVDINCGMFVVDISDWGCISDDRQEVDYFIHHCIPSGFHIHPESKVDYKDYKNLFCLDGMYKPERFPLAIGSLGGGNHFIEVGRSANTGKTYLTIHTGSRNMGNQVAKYYQNIAIKAATCPQKDLCYLDGTQMENYLHDMAICQNYADENRAVIASLILGHFGKKLKDFEYFTTKHNYIDLKTGIMRKGAVSAQEGERLVIPMNMRDGILLCVGKGNPEWNFSAPHGAGRVMSRGEAKRTLDMSDYESSMKGIYTTCVGTSTLDESPMAYKQMSEIISNIGDTVDILDIIKPIYSFKDGEKND